MGVGEVLIAYARRMFTLNEETAMAPGANNNTADYTSGLAPRLLESVIPAALAVTTPSLPYIGLALHSGLDVGVGTAHSLPSDIVYLDNSHNLPQLPNSGVNLLRPINACDAAHDLCTGLEQQVMCTLKNTLHRGRASGDKQQLTR